MCFPLQERDNVTDMGNIMVDTPSGAQIPMKRIAQILLESGLIMINREDGKRRTAVLCNVRGRDLGGFVEE